MKQILAPLTRGFDRKAITTIVLSATLTAGACYHQDKVSVGSFTNYLSHYGFDDLNKRRALENLMRRADIIKPLESLASHFPPRHNSASLMFDILKFVKDTQEKFTVRSGTQERWDVKAADWTVEHRDANFDDLKTLGFIDEIKPKNKNPDAICVLGAVYSRIENRLNYVENLVKDGVLPANLVFLVGERPVTVNIDGSMEDLEKIASKYNIDSLKKLTETHMAKEVYQKSALYNRFPTTILDTPAGDLPRPTTQTTVLELIGWLKQNPNVKNLVFVTNQPYVKYQQAVIDNVFRNANFKIDFEVVGSAEASKENGHLIVEALGSFVWAATPNLLLTINKQVNNSEAIKMAEELYKKQPLVYKEIEKLFDTSKSSTRSI